MTTLLRSVYDRWISPLIEPRSSEKLQLIRERWDTLDEKLKFPQQTAGVYNNACGATHSIMEKCNFACTSCYLSDIANHTLPLPFEAVKEQLDTLRRHLGPAGKAQITSGEVTLLSKDELGRIVAYAKEIGLDPMVMTNGQRFVQYPDYLPTLVEKYGLEKVSVHIDTTQKGRKGMKMGVSEATIHPIRDQFARMIKDVRKKTGKKLQAVQTMTVTAQNFDDIPTVMAWMLDNVDAFRMISFQPIAEVGRTLDERPHDMRLDAVWAKICEGAGESLNRHSMYFGHPACNIVAPVIVVSFGGENYILEPAREGKKWDARFFNKALKRFGGFTTVHSSYFQIVLRIISMLIRNVDLILELPFYGVYRLWAIRAWLPKLLLHTLTFRKIRIRPLAIVVHKFLSSDELDTPLGKERLKNCVFKLPVRGKMVSMCEMNGTSLRENLNRDLLKLKLGVS
jgi:MoaA/NifB/PqqE/SkfB family radical SAM enzyme